MLDLKEIESASPEDKMLMLVELKKKLGEIQVSRRVLKAQHFKSERKLWDMHTEMKKIKNDQVVLNRSLGLIKGRVRRAG